MRILSSTTGFLGSHIYYVIEGLNTVIIDPGDAEIAEQIILEESLVVDQIILTHEHCDHSYGCIKIREKYNSKVVSSSACSANLKDERRNQSRYFEAFATVQERMICENPKGIKPFSTEADITFNEDIKIEWKGHVFYIRETPGHSEGSVCILLDNKYLFSGDTMMWGEPVNTRFTGGSRKMFEKISLPWLKTLDPDIHVYPGHLEEFELGERLKYPILQ